MLALLFLDLECPCLCSASVTLEQRPLESLLWLLLCFGLAWSPGQAELVNVTLGRRKGEICLHHPGQAGEHGMGELLNTASGGSTQRTGQRQKDEPRCPAHSVTSV